MRTETIYFKDHTKNLMNFKFKSNLRSSTIVGTVKKNLCSLQLKHITFQTSLTLTEIKVST